MARDFCRTSIRLATALTLCAALFTGATTAAAQASAPAPVAAEAAKGTKKKKKKPKCDSGKQSPVFNALSCTSLTRTIANSPPTPNGTERYEFCRNGTYRYNKADFDGDRFFSTTYTGRWKVISSSGSSAGLQGAIQYSVENYVSIFGDGTPAEPPPPAILSQSIVFGPFGTSFAGGTFLYGGVSC